MSKTVKPRKVKFRFKPKKKEHYLLQRFTKANPQLAAPPETKHD